MGLKYSCKAKLAKIWRDSRFWVCKSSILPYEATLGKGCLTICTNFGMKFSKSPSLFWFPILSIEAWSWICLSERLTRASQAVRLSLGCTSATPPDWASMKRTFTLRQFLPTLTSFCVKSSTSFFNSWSCAWFLTAINSFEMPYL